MRPTSSRLSSTALLAKAHGRPFQPTLPPRIRTAKLNSAQATLLSFRSVEANGRPLQVQRSLSPSETAKAKARSTTAGASGATTAPPQHLPPSLPLDLPPPSPSALRRPLQQMEQNDLRASLDDQASRASQWRAPRTSPFDGETTRLAPRLHLCRLSARPPLRRARYWEARMAD